MGSLLVLGATWIILAVLTLPMVIFSFMMFDSPHYGIGTVLAFCAVFTFPCFAAFAGVMTLLFTFCCCQVKKPWQRCITLLLVINIMIYFIIMFWEVMVLGKD